MIKSEIHKLFKLKAVFFSLLFLIGALIYSMMVYGEFGHNISRLLTIYSDKGMIAYSEKNGELLVGQEGYEQNKEAAAWYEGEVNDRFLAQLHSDFISSSYVGFENGERFYHATYRFFQEVFNIGSDNYAKRDDVWGEVEGPLQYGFTGDWDAYGNILRNFFFLFSFFVIIFAAPLFSYDRECNMTEFLGTAEHGGRRLFQYKARAAFCAVNFLMFTILLVISIIHFSQYGFANANVSIQCSFEQRFLNAAIPCTMGRLTIWTLLFGVIGCNTILLITILISMLSQATLTVFSMSLVITWLPGYPVLQMIGNEGILKGFLSVIPINALYFNVLIKKVSTWQALYGIFMIRLVLFVLLFLITGIIWRKNYLALNRRGD